MSKKKKEKKKEKDMQDMLLLFIYLSQNSSIKSIGNLVKIKFYEQTQIANVEMILFY